MDRNASLRRVKRVGTGLCFILFPLVFVFAFSIHPGLLHPHLLDPRGLILRAHDAGLLQFGHVLVTLSTALLVVIAVHFMKLLDRTSWAWAGLVGAAVGILGAIILAADKGALCLTMSALDTVPASKFAAMMPGLLAMFSHKGWMVLLWGIAFLPIGFAILAVALFKTRTLPRWQSACFLAGVLFVGFPDGAEIINLTASILMAAALVPYGMRMLAPRHPVGSAAAPARESLRVLEALPEAGVDARPWPRQSCTTCRRK
ncbi:MAG: hypothetical protein WCN81_14150 [Actinomycetes bacterium]